MLRNTLYEMFEHSTDAVFGIDTAGKIRFTNHNFEKLMGYSHNQLCDVWCADILCGIDLHGQAFCGVDCPVPKTDSEGHAIKDFDLVVKRNNGERVLVNIGASYIPPELHALCGEVNVFFSMRQVDPQQLLHRMATSSADKPDKADTGRRLTSRENQILGLAAKGMSTSEIARTLSVSTQTVRSHFKNIYLKLEVNSRTEAVIFAIRHDLH